MSQMTDDLRNKSGDAYDAAFIASMIEHDQLHWTWLNCRRGGPRHAEIQELSEGIIAAQKREIAQMKARQKKWGYETEASEEGSMH